MVVNTIWDTELSEVEPTSKLIYVWSFTNPACGMAGVYPMPVKNIAVQLDLERSDTQVSMDELCNMGLLWHDGKWMWVRGRVKNLHTRTKQIAAAIDKDLKVVPDGHPILRLFAEKYGDEPWLSELQPNLSRGSSEVQKTAQTSEVLNLTRTSSEVPLDVVLDVDEVVASEKRSGDEVFAQLWNAHPVKRKEDMARHALFKDVDPQDFELMLAQHARYLAVWSDPAYVPDLHNWLKSWRDEPRPSPKSKTPGPSPKSAKYDAGIENAA